MTHRPYLPAGIVANGDHVVSLAEIYRDMRRADGEDFEFLFAAFLDSARADPEAVARAIERGELPTG